LSNLGSREDWVIGAEQMRFNQFINLAGFVDIEISEGLVLITSNSK